MSKHDPIHRIDWETEIIQMMGVICEGLLHTGCHRYEVQIAVFQQCGHLATYFPEMRRVQYTKPLKRQIDAYPRNSDRIPLQRTLEIDVTLAAMTRIGDLLIGFGYTLGECERIVRMFQSVLIHHLKADEDAAKEVHAALIPVE